MFDVAAHLLFTSISFSEEVDVILHCPKCGSDVLIQLDESIDVVGNHSLTRAPVRGSETVLSTRHLRR